MAADDRNEGAERYVLRVAEGRTAGRAYRIRPPCVVLVGRSEAAHVWLTDEGVARTHCLLVFDEAGVTAYDLHGRATTTIGRHKLKKQPINPGDELQVGGARLRLEVDLKPGGDPGASQVDLEETSSTLAEMPACERCDRVLSARELHSKLTQYVYGVAFCAACGILIERQDEDFPGYKILGELGRGGMSEVFKAIDLKRERVVALKTLRCNRAASQIELQYFAREVQVCRLLNHPNVVRIYSVARHKDEIYFTMSYVSGETLQEYVHREGTAPIRFAARVLHQVAQALEYARRNQIVHRDVKPANVLLERSGRALLADFGLAKSYAAAALSGLAVSGDRVIGTPYYMAPEQVANPGNVDHRADLYSLGAVAYFTLTGQRPFQAESVAEALFKVVQSDPVPIRTLRPETPKMLADIVERLMEKDPAKRFQKARDVIGALRSGR